MELVAAADDHVLVGCTLPPKVAGVPRGAVLLSVPHVVPSAAADAVAEQRDTAIAPLPRSPLVRVRWWGEDRPGTTLFRPTRVAHEQGDGEEEGESRLCMRYPVCVPLEQLLDYLRDMNELVLDVVDRTTRKKIGRSVFQFPTTPIGGVEEAVETLRRSNALCEIHSTADDAVVLGYLSVNFEVEWTAMPDVSTPLKWTNTSTQMLPTVSVNPRQPLPIELERNIQQRLSFSSVSSSSAASGVQPQPRWRHRVNTSSPAAPSDHSDEPQSLNPSVESNRLDDLLEKGRALERSMSQAVTDHGVANSSPDHVVAAAESAPSPVSMMLMMAPYEAMTEELETSWERVLEEADKIQPSTQSLRQEPNAATPVAPQNAVSLGDHNALEISFESMELEQEMLDRLRQLREGSISTRFSPIQLVVAHEHPSCLLHSPMSDPTAWIDAFAVSSSLRKRQWRTNYTHALPLRPPGPTRSDTLHLARQALKFRVRCKPQHASPPGRRRREASPRIDLCADVAAEDLFDHCGREWVLSLPLRIDSSKSNAAPSGRSVPRRNAIVGRLTVKFRFCRLPESLDEDRDQTNEEAASSQWTLDEASPRPTPKMRSERQSNDNADREHTTHLREIIRAASTELGTPVFFGLLVGRAVLMSVLGTKDNGMRGRRSVRIEYGTPAFFGRSAKALRLKRSAKASLHGSESDCLRANFQHMNAFPLDVTDELVQKLEHGLVILEVWIQEQSTTLASYATEKLLGVVKIPLHAFGPSMRDVDAIQKCLSHSTPVMGVDQDFPIVDPLDDEVNGQLHVRMAFGSAEQMFNLKSALAAMLKVQSVVRGWLTRRALGYWKRFELTTWEDESSQVADQDSQAHGHEHEHEQELDASANEVIDEHSNSEMTDSRGELVPASGSHHDQRIVRLDVRVEIREKCEASDAVIGCEVFGHLRLNGAHLSAASPAGPRFTLWWDANDEQLNSHFVHTLQASSPMTGFLLQDVILLFRVEPQPPAGTEKRAHGKSVMGGGVIDLASVVADAFDGLNSGSSVVDFVEHVDVPIEWDHSEGEETLVRVLPLRLGLRITHKESINIEPHRTNAIAETRHDRKQVTSSESLSRTERLLPASLHLCADLQRIAELEDMLTAAIRQSKSHTLTQAIERGAVRMALAMSLCLGTELHPDETSSNDLVQDDRGRWHKQFRVDGIDLDVENRVQLLPSITQGDVYVRVHPELVSYLQEESLEVKIYASNDGEEEDAALVGTVSVPLSALLFRPSGVQGSFSVRVGNEMAGRVGVHIYIDQDERPDPAVSDASMSDHIEIEREAANDEAPLLRTGSPLDADTEESREPSFEQAVASIHEAAQQIQYRLARLSAQAVTSEGGNVHSDPVSLACPRNESHEDSTAMLATSPTTPPAASPAPGQSLGRDSLFEEAEAPHSPVQSVDVPEEAEVGLENEQSQDAPGEDTDREQVETVDGFDPFQPITLASLGIDEIELSPLTEPNSPAFRLDDDEPETHDEFDARGSTPMADGSSPTLDEEEDAVITKREDEEAIIARSEELEEQELAEQEEHDTIEANLDAQDLLARPTTPSEDSEPVNSSKYTDLASRTDDSNDDRTNVDSLMEAEANGTSRIAEMPLADSVDGIETLSVASTEQTTSSASQQEQTLPAPAVEEPVGCEGTSAETNDAREHTEESPKGALGEAGVDPARQRHEDVGKYSCVEAASENDTDQDDTALALEESNAVDEPSELAVPAEDRRSPDRCSVDTETHDTSEGDTKESGVRSVFVEQAVQADEARVLVNKECQTLDEETPETSENGDGENVGVGEGVTNDQTDVITQEPTEQPSTTIEDSLEVATTRPTDQLGDVHRALPVEKFKIAWQLLNEIRAMYIDTNDQELEPARAAEAQANRTPAPLLTSQDLSTSVTCLPVVGDDSAITGASQEVPVERPLGIPGPSTVSPSVPSPSWEWRDAASLRAEVEERLQASKREYEEALALSQSISSMHSWASASKKDEWEGKAQAFSASARAKRQERERAQALFREDTETERIARIMQGSLRGWFPEDDEEGDGETSDDDAEYVDHYF